MTAVATEDLQVLSSLGTQQLEQQQQPVWPFMGFNTERLPMRRGAPNCPAYMGTGVCDTGPGCRLHHPEGVMVPQCVVEGGSVDGRGSQWVGGWACGWGDGQICSCSFLLELWLHRRGGA